MGKNWKAGGALYDQSWASASYQNRKLRFCSHSHFRALLCILMKKKLIDWFAIYLSLLASELSFFLSVVFTDILPVSLRFLKPRQTLLLFCLIKEYFVLLTCSLPIIDKSWLEMMSSFLICIASVFCILN